MCEQARAYQEEWMFIRVWKLESTRRNVESEAQVDASDLEGGVLTPSLYVWLLSLIHI